MCLAIPGPAEGDLDNPALRGPLGWVKEMSLLVDIEEGFLDNLLRFAMVIQNAKSDSKHKPGVSSEQQCQGVRILGLQASHEFFIAGSPSLSYLRRRDGGFPSSPPHHGECKCAPIRRRAHFQTAVSLLGENAEPPRKLSGNIHQEINVFPDKSYAARLPKTFAGFGTRSGLASYPLERTVRRCP